MKNKKRALPITLIIVVVLIIIILFSIFNLEKIELTDKEKTLEQFSDEEKDKISKVVKDFSSSQGHDVSTLTEFFDEFEEDRLDDLLVLCKSGIATSPITCYKLLAIQKPNKKEEICNDIKKDVCDYYPNKDDCLNSIENFKEECKLLLPFLR